MEGGGRKEPDAVGEKPPTISEMCQEIPKPTKLETDVHEIDIKPPRKVKMSCTQRVSIRLNSLESIWYCILVTVVTVFLLGDALRQYKHYKNLDWPDQPPKGEFGLYGLLIFSAFALILLFIPTQIFKVGNRANDQDKLGIIKARSSEFRRVSASSSHIKMLRQYVYKIRGVSKHMGPIGATLHMLSAFCLLLPLMFLQAKAIESGLLPPEMIWKSEVAVISAPAAVFESSAEAAVFVQDSLATAVPPHDSSGMAPDRDPFRVFMVTINYLNYMVPLFFYAIRYAEVFWVSHKGFAFIFSAQLMMNSIHYALGFVGMSIMYKLSTYIHGQYNTMEDYPEMAQPSLLILAFLSMNITVFLSAVTFYLFGYTRYKISESEVVSAEDESQKSKNLLILRFNGLIPHVGAFIVFVILVLCKGFFIVEYIIVYRWINGGDGRILCCIIFDVLYLLMWSVMWVIFTIKRTKWNFGFFSHPIPHMNMDGQSDSGQRSSNSDLEMNSNRLDLNHSHNNRSNMRQTSEESETSFGNSPNTSLLANQHHDQTNEGMVGDEPDGRDGHIKYADESSSVGHATPQKENSNVEGVNGPAKGGESNLMTDTSPDDESPTVSCPMLPPST